MLTFLTRPLLVTTLALAGAFAQVHAQTPDDTLYRAFGGQPGLQRLMDDFVDRLLADPRMKPFFVDAELADLKKALVVQFCEVSGGPCRRDPQAKGMRQVHEAQDITKTDFNALVEVLQQSMDAQGIGFSAQNQLLARLAPMHREIVNKH